MKKYSNREKQPKMCWVGDQQKMIYDTPEEAEAAALVAQHDYGAPPLAVYKCEYGNHWHLSSRNKTDSRPICGN